MLLVTQSGDLFVGGRSSRERTQRFSWLPRNSLTSGTSSLEKHLENFPKVFLSSVLAASPGDLLATWLSRENRVFCANGSIFKRFQFFSRTSVTVHCLPYLKHSQTHCVTLEHSIVLHHFNLKSSRKWYGFSLSLYILHVLSLVYLNLWVVDLIWEICCFSDGLDECLFVLVFLGIVD